MATDPEVSADDAAALGAALLEQAQSDPDPDTLSAAVAVLAAALNTTADDHPDRPGRAANLGLALRLRADRGQDYVADLDAAVEVGRWAVDQADPADPDRAGYLANYADSLQSRYERAGRLVDLTEALAARRIAVTAGADHPALPQILGTLGTCLVLVADATGGSGLVDEAVAVCTRATELAPKDSPWYASSQANLAVAFAARATDTGSTTDLNAAIGAGRASLAATSEGHPSLPGRASNLASALHLRFLKRGERADLNGAVAAAGQAATVAAAFDDPYLGMYLSNLGYMLRVRTEAFGDPDDLEAAVDVGLAAAAATPVGHPGRPTRLANAAMALLTRHEREIRDPTDAGETSTAQPSATRDLDMAVALTAAAVSEAGDKHAGRGLYLSNLGLLLRHRYVVTGRVEDLDEAVAAGEQSLTVRPPGHPDRAGALLNLAECRMIRHRRSDRSPARSLEDRDTAFGYWREATATAAAPVVIRLAAARRWATMAAEDSRWAEAQEASHWGMLLLPELAWLGIGRDDQEHRLAGQDGAAGEFAAIAVAAGDLPGAVVAAEQSRSILWARLRSQNVDDLRQRAPDLWVELRRVADGLAVPSPAERAR